MTNSPCDACTRQECTNRGNGCKEWEDWFVQNWNRNIHRKVPKPPRRVWRYEHPDRVREMAPKKEEEMSAAELDGKADGG